MVLQFLRGVVIRFIYLAINRNGNISHSALYNTYTTELRLPLDKKLHFIRRQTATFLACLDTITLLSTLDLTPTQHKDEL